MKKPAAFICMLFMLFRITAAQPGLGIGNLPISITPDSVAFNDTVQIKMFVENTGNTFFSGTFQLYFSVNGDSSSLLDTTHYFASLVSFDTIQVVIYQKVSPVYYSIGDDIVVIWPVADLPGVPTTDSGTAHIYIDSALGVQDLFRQDIKVSYESSNQLVRIDYGNSWSQIKEVDCYSISGQRVKRYDYPVNKILLSEASAELLFIIILTKQNELLTFKIPHL